MVPVALCTSYIHMPAVRFGGELYTVTLEALPEFERKE